MSTARIARVAAATNEATAHAVRTRAGRGTTNPTTAVLRQDEDWAWLADVPEDERRALDGLKRLPLNADGSTYLTFAFDGLLGVERFDDESFGDFPGEDSSVHVRANPHVALSFGDRARLYGALKYDDVGDRRFLPSPADDDGPDVHQLFAELAFGDLVGGSPHDAFARLGRQELHYGAVRLVSIRNGPNVRFDFDGAVVRARLGPTISEALYVRPTENDLGAGFLAGIVSYGFADAPWTPVIASRFGASSGDDDPGRSRWCRWVGTALQIRIYPSG